MSNAIWTNFNWQCAAIAYEAGEFSSFYARAFPWDCSLVLKFEPYTNLVYL
jgi:hypothetical protein